MEFTKNLIDKGSIFWHKICYKFNMRMIDFKEGGDNREVNTFFGMGNGQWVKS